MDGGFEDGREHARRTRHDAIYGVLAECDTDCDSDEDNGSRRRKLRRDASEPDLSNPVRFVSAAYVSPSHEQGPGPVKTAVTEEDDADMAGAEGADMELLPARFGKITDDARARREKKERERAATARRSQASVKPPVAPGSVQFNAKVAEMMRSKGYIDGMGLGKDGQGITAPLEATGQCDKAGLGYAVEGFQEPMPVSAKENLPPPASTKERQPRWSKKARPRRAPVLTKNALLAMRAEQEREGAAGQPAVVQKVIDKRGRQERVLTDLKCLNDEHEMKADEAPMPELQQNVRILVDDTKASIVRLDSQLRREHEKAASLVREEEKLSKQEAVQKRQLQVMETIAGALEQVRMDDSAGILTLEGLLLTFRDLKARFKEEFKMCGMAWIACQFAHPLLMRFFQGWQPLLDPSVGLEVMSSWKDLLEGDGPYDFSHDAASMAPYAQLVCEVILPPVRTSGTNSWEAMVPEPMLDFLKTWGQVLPPVALQLILEHVVMPKLSAAVDSWDLRREQVPIHVWVHPWLPMLEQRSIETLCHSIRYKLSSVLHTWQAHDTSTLLSPWKNVFDSAVWGDLIARYIVPKLKMALREFQINPADQKLDQSRWVMLWASTIPMHHVVQLLEVDFFRKWHQVLYHWLRSPNPDFNEIVNWYKGWRGMFPPDLLADERIRMLFTLGLDMMDRAAEGLEVVEPGTGTGTGTRENVSCLRGTEKIQVHAAQKASQVPSCHTLLKKGWRKYQVKKMFLK